MPYSITSAIDFLLDSKLTQLKVGELAFLLYIRKKPRLFRDVADGIGVGKTITHRIANKFTANGLDLTHLQAQSI